MKHRMARQRAALVGIAASALLAASSVSAQVVISQIYPGGGNSGATYNRKYVELFNTSNAPVSLNGMSVQYAAQAGTNWSQKTNLTGSIPAQGYFLIGLGSGANGVALPLTPDQNGGTWSPSGTNGNVALVSNTTTLTCQTTACASDPAVVDLVGYGTGAAFEGSPAPQPTNATFALFRAGGGCTDTDNNSADFSSVAVSPRNSGSATNPCVAPPSDPVVTLDGTFSTAEGNPPIPSTLTFVATITPVPAAGQTVTFDVAVTGDASRFTYAGPTNIVVDDTSDGTIEIDVQTVPNIDDDGDATITLTLSNFVGTDATQVDPLAIEGTIVDDDLAFEGIHAIQGSAQLSPRDGEVVTTRGIVTGLRNNAFFIQTPDGDDDNDPATSEGLYVYVGNNDPMPPGLALGDLVFVQGTVDEFVPPADPNQLPVTELVQPITVTTISPNNPLPTPVVLTTLDPDGALDQLESLEFMRVTIADFTVTAPTSGSADESFGVITGMDRPFREPGVDAHDCGDNLPLEAPENVPCWDANPELLRVKTNYLSGGAAIPLRGGTRLQNLTGVLDYAFRRYSILTRSAEAPVVVPNTGATGTPAAAPLSTELTIAGFNVENLSGPSGTTYNRKANKIATTVVDYMHLPDIIGFVEVANIETLEDLASRINLLAGANDPEYAAELVSTDGTQRLGFLVKTRDVLPGTPRVQVTNIEEYGAGLHVVCPDGVSETIGLLNDRPPLVMDVVINAANGASYPATVINNHLKSLIGVDSLEDADADYACFNDPQNPGGEGRRNRAKRQQNAEYLTLLVSTLQSDNPERPIVLVGDFNAFQFNDGYGDLMNTIQGTPAADDTTVVPDDGMDLIDPDLINLTDLVVPEERYSYVFEGNAQVLDHIVVNQAVVDTTRSFRRETPRVNSDYTTVDASSTLNPFRNSDHDPAVGYFDVSAFYTSDLVVSVDVLPTSAEVGDTVTYTYTLTNDGGDTAIEPVLTLTLPAGTGFVSHAPEAGWNCTTPAVGASGTVVCRNATLANGASAAFEVTAELLLESAGTTVTATLGATAESTDPSTPNLDTADTVVAALPVNNPPAFAPDVYAFTTSVTPVDGDVIGAVTATDADSDPLTYSITAGDAGGAFAFVGNTLTVADADQLTPGSAFNLTVEVSDDNGGTDQATIEISVPVPNSAPIFVDEPYAFDVNENAAAGTAVGSVSATDPDAGDVLSYAIVAGNTGDAFAIDADTGAITVNTSAALVPGSTFDLTVEVEDGDGASDSTVVTITVIDLPDAIFADGFED